MYTDTQTEPISLLATPQVVFTDMPRPYKRVNQSTKTLKAAMYTDAQTEPISLISPATPQVVFTDMPYKRVNQSTNHPLKADLHFPDFKPTQEQVDAATAMIHEEIKKVFIAMRPDVQSDDPKYKEKLDFTMKIAKEFESLSEGDKYAVVTDALSNYPLMLQLTGAIELRDIVERNGVMKFVISSEFFLYLSQLVRDKTPMKFSDVTDEAVNANGVKRKNPRPTAGARKKAKSDPPQPVLVNPQPGLAPVHRMGLAPIHRIRSAPINQAQRRKKKRGSEKKEKK